MGTPVREICTDVMAQPETIGKVAGGFNDGSYARETNDDIFIVEFNAMLRNCINNSQSKYAKLNIRNMPMLNMPTLIQGGAKQLYATVLHIKEPYYNRLNDALVIVLRDRTFGVRKALNNGEFIKDEKGKAKLFDYKVDGDSFIVKTRINIHKSNYVLDENGKPKLTAHGEKIRYSESTGFAYLDYVDEEGTRYYFYSVPKKYLFKANMTALVLAVHPHPNSYYMYKIAFRNGHYYHLCVIDYKREQNDNTTRVLGVANKVDYKAEINELLAFWQAEGKYKGKTPPVMFDTEITEIPNSTGDYAKNIGCMFSRGKLPVESYEQRSTIPFDATAEDAESMASN